MVEDLVQVGDRQDLTCGNVPLVGERLERADDPNVHVLPGEEKQDRKARQQTPKDMSVRPVVRRRGSKRETRDATDVMPAIFPPSSSAEVIQSLASHDPVPSSSERLTFVWEMLMLRTTPTKVT